jgi:hypothetical protein
MNKHDIVEKSFGQAVVFSKAMGRVIYSSESDTIKRQALDIIEEQLRREFSSIFHASCRFVYLAEQEAKLKAQVARDRLKRQRSMLNLERDKITLSLQESRASRKEEGSGIYAAANNRCVKLEKKVEFLKSELIEKDKFKSQLKFLLIDRMGQEDYVALMQEVGRNINQEK